MAKNNKRLQLMLMSKERLLDMAYGRWKITVPDTIDPDIIEPILTAHGKGCFYEAPEYGWVFGRMVSQGMLDANGNPETVDIILKNSVTISGIPFADVIPVYNNRRHTQSLSQIIDYAWRIASLQLTIDTNIMLRKFPGFVACNQKEQATVKNLLNAWAGDDMIVFGRKDSHQLTDMLQYISFGVPDVATPTDMLKNRVEHDALAYLGIDSSPAEKGAQVGMAEVVSNMGKAYAFRLNYQGERDRCTEIAAKRGVEIKWEWEGLKAAQAFLDMGGNSAEQYDSESEVDAE